MYTEKIRKYYFWTNHITELSRKIKELRRTDIMESKKGCKSTTNPSTRISDSIPVSKGLKLSSILFWKSEEDGDKT